MRFATAIAAAALLFAAGCRDQGTGPAPEYRPHEAGTVDHALCLLGFTAVPVREVETGHHLVEASVNGTSGLFVLDTGANMTVIDRSHLRDFGLSPQPGAIGGAVSIGAAGQASRVPIDSFSIGDVAVRQDRIVASELGQLLDLLSRASGETVNGIIGQDVLNEHRAIIDVARPMLYLVEADRDPRPVAAERCRRSDEGAGTDAGRAA